MRSNISSHAEAKAFYIGLSVEGFANNLFCPTGPRTVHQKQVLLIFTPTDLTGYATFKSLKHIALSALNTQSYRFHYVLISMVNACS